MTLRFLTPPESAVVSALAALSCLGADDPVLRGAAFPRLPSGPTDL